MSRFLYKVIYLSLWIGLFHASAWSKDHKENNQWFIFRLTNDIVFQTDKYYTNGINLEYITDKGIKIFEPLHFLHNAGAVHFNAVTLRQDIFTPEKRRTGQYNQLDRPFAAYVIAGSSKTSLDYTSKYVITSTFEVGVLGKYAGGEIVQNTVHSLLPTSSHVFGWENQIKSDLALNFGLEIEKGFLTYPWFGLSANVWGKAGLPYTYAGTGLTIRIGEYLHYFSNLGFYGNSGWQVYFFSTLNTNLVLYNATIQGGLFHPVRKSISPKLTSLIFKAKGGLHLSYKSYALELGMQQVSPEFKNGTLHRWGYISFIIQL
jgi:hypothetical protein